MADSSSIGAGAPSKPIWHSFHAELPPIMGGLVQHALISPSTQVQILSIVDETGSASIGDIIAELPGHPDPVGAILIMARLTILTIEVNGILDANTIVRRCNEASEPDGFSSVEPSNPDQSGNVPSGQSAGTELPTGLSRICVTPFSAKLIVAEGDARRSFSRTEALRQPGIYGLMNNHSCYIGMGSDVGARIATGQQPIESVDTIFAITDNNNNLTAEDAKVAERILWSRLAASRERVLVNGVPDGSVIDPQRYSELDVFVAQVCLALRHEGLLFTQGAARSVLAGPRSEPSRVAPLRRLNDIPEGEVMELRLPGGRMALAARQSESRWVLLQGSEVRPEAVASANSSARYLRSHWLHTGLLDASTDGRSYVLNRDLIFSSGSAAAHFCCGSKGKSLAGWQSIDPDGGYDPETPELIAS